MSAFPGYLLEHQQEQMLEVAVDDVDILLPSSVQTAIGTENLNGCTCVVILGAAIILAHISPLPGESRQWSDASIDIQGASTTHHNLYLDKVQKLIAENIAHFPPSTTAWGVFCRGRDGTVEMIREVIQNRLIAIGYHMRPAYYEEVPVEHVVHSRGQVVAFRDQNTTKLFVEKTRLWAHDSTSAHLAGANPKPTTPAQITSDEPDSGENGFLLERARDSMLAGARPEGGVPWGAYPLGVGVEEALGDSQSRIESHDSVADTHERIRLTDSVWDEKL